MKIKDLASGNKLKGNLISIVFHGTIILLAMTATYKMAVPEGVVSSPMEGTLSKGESNTPVEIIQPNTQPLPAKKNQGEVVRPKRSEKKASLPTKLPTKEITSREAEAPVMTAVEESREALDAEGDQNSEPENVATDGESEGEEGGGSPPAGEILSENEFVPGDGNPKPNYPLLARIQRHQGTVVVRFVIGADGRVTKTWVHKSSGYSNLDQAAIDSQSQWKYQPGKTGTVQKQIIFNLVGQEKELRYQTK